MPVVALGPAGESGLAHLGLSACSVETGELPHSPPACGSPAESDRPAVSGWGRRCSGASPGGEGPDLGHRRWRGSPWWARGGKAGQQRGTGDGRLEKRWRAPARVRGAVVSSCRGRCDDGGAHRWLEVALDGKVASASEGGDWLGVLTVYCGGRWLSGRLGVAQRRTRAVRGGQHFGAWTRGARQ
jgi:hypothetical protein